MDRCNPDYKDAEWALYRFAPSMAAAVVFAIMFLLVTIVHVFQMIRTRTWYLTPFCLGGASEAVGYIARSISAQQVPGCWDIGPYIIQNVLILIAPALMAASIYMILGRIVLLTNGEGLSPIRRNWLTKIFVGGDVLSLFMQTSGGGMMASSSDMFAMGKNVIIGGLFVQLIIFGVFIFVAALFHHRLNRNPTGASLQPAVRWRSYLVTLYVSGALIWIRSLFRVIEYLEGSKGHLMSTEVYIFIFDALLMLIVMGWMAWFHPSEIGLLLRGQDTVSDGIALIWKGHPFQKVNT